MHGIHHWLVLMMRRLDMKRSRMLKVGCRWRGHHRCTCWALLLLIRQNMLGASILSSRTVVVIGARISSGHIEVLVLACLVVGAAHSCRGRRRGWRTQRLCTKLRRDSITSTAKSESSE